jgi:hypothetical protein
MQKFGLGYSDQYSDDLYKYLRKQGYSDAILKDSGLVTIDEVRGGRDKFWNRAMFPILDANSKVIAFGGRVMGEGEPKYLNSPETPIFNKSRNLFGLYLAKKTKRKQFILCEGYMDVIALHQAGYYTREYSGNVYGNSGMISTGNLVLLGDFSQGGAASGNALADSIEGFTAVLLQGIYQRQRTSGYNTTMMHFFPQLNTAYWAGMKDRNNSYTCYVIFTDSTHCSLSGNRQVIIYGMP